MDIKKTMQNLDKNGIKPYFVEKKEDVVPLVKTLINKYLAAVLLRLMKQELKHLCKTEIMILLTAPV